MPAKAWSRAFGAGGGPSSIGSVKPLSCLAVAAVRVLMILWLAALTLSWAAEAYVDWHRKDLIASVYELVSTQVKRMVLVSRAGTPLARGASVGLPLLCMVGPAILEKLIARLPC